MTALVTLKKGASKAKRARFASIARALYCEPWLIQPTMHATLCDIFQAHVTGKAHEAGMRAQVFNIDGDDEDDPAPYENVNGVAVIPVRGVIGRRMDSFEKACGGVDLLDVEAAINKANADYSVKALVLCVDSPGGTATGVADTASMIAAQSVKPLWAYADGNMASAACWLTAGCTAIYCGQCADLGYVGVYMPMLDRSAQYAANGIKVEMIKSGDLKGAGYPGTSLTDDQRAAMQAHVDTLGAMFRAFVGGRRTGVKEDSMRGQGFIGMDAVKAGFADSVATLEKCINDARDYAEQQQKKGQVAT